jgi:hypothetical protein
MPCAHPVKLSVDLPPLLFDATTAHRSESNVTLVAHPKILQAIRVATQKMSAGDALDADVV